MNSWFSQWFHFQNFLFKSNFFIVLSSLSNKSKNKFNTQIMFAIKETLLYIFIKAWFFTIIFFTAYMIILKLKIFVVDRIIMHFDHKTFEWSYIKVNQSEQWYFIIQCFECKFVEYMQSWKWKFEFTCPNQILSKKKNCKIIWTNFDWPWTVRPVFIVRTVYVWTLC